MKKILLLTLSVMFLLLGDAVAQKRKIKKANEDTVEWKYEIESVGIGSDNVKTVRVWSYSKKTPIAKAQAPKNAVHGIIFRGAPANTQERISKVLPLARNYDTMSKNQAFFDNFFADGGEYRRYVTTTDIADEVRKVDKRMYKVGVVVNIQYDALRKALEQQGIIKGLSSGF